MSFPFVGFPGGNTYCPSVISYPANVPCPGPLPSSDLFNVSVPLGTLRAGVVGLPFHPGQGGLEAGRRRYTVNETAQV